MAYNNGFPMTYQQYYPQYQQYQQPQQVQQQQQMQQQQAPQQSNIIWVSGEAGAKAYLVAPNTTVQLWDSENNCIYLKSADASGMPSIKTLDYTIRDAVQPVQTLQVNEGEFIHRDELDALKRQIEGLEKEIQRLKPKRGEHNVKSDI